MKKISILYIAALSLFVLAQAASADVGETEAPAVPAPEVAAKPAPSAPVQEAAAKIAPAPAAQSAAKAQSASPSRGKAIRQTTLRETEPESMAGKVDCVMPASLARPKARIAVIDDAGNRCEFVVKCLAVIYDPDGAMLSLCEIGPGAKVQVNYRTRPGGTKEAFSVKVLR
jgi:hypothetical protein